MPHQCAAISAAQAKTGLTYAQIAEKIGSTEARVTDICTGKAKPTAAEFQALASVLGISGSAPADAAHTTV